MVIYFLYFWFLLLIATIAAIIFQNKYRWVMCKVAGGATAVLFLIVLFIPDNNTPSPAAATSAPRRQPDPIETKEQYLASTQQIGGEDSPIYRKEFLKNPDKFLGKRVNVVGKILEIEEENGKTVMQIYITRDYDTVIVRHPGSIPFYKEDLIIVYGEGEGSVTGMNRFGAEMKWPVLLAKYVEKFQYQ